MNYLQFYTYFKKCSQTFEIATLYKKKKNASGFSKF